MANNCTSTSGYEYGFYSKVFSAYHQKVMNKEVPDSFYNLSTQEQREWIYELLKKQYPSSPDSILNLQLGIFYSGDSGISEGARPEWLDIEKYRRGQQVVKKYLFGIALNNIVSTALSFTLLDATNIIVATRKSSTPYTSFKRYLSTLNIMKNWYFDDPFAKGTSAFNEMQLVRKLHMNARKKVLDSKGNDLTISNAWCPAHEAMMEDFKECCPALNEKSPFAAYNFENIGSKGLSQGHMSLGQFTFTGLIILYPKEFGMPDITDEELEDYVYVWRCLGYLLGVEDEFNFCRGNLKEVQQRTRDCLEILMKPNFPYIYQEWEHMTRCMFEGMRFYLPIPTFDLMMLYCFKLMDFNMPRFEKQIPLIDWLLYKSFMSVLFITGRLPITRSVVNNVLLWCLGVGNKLNANKHKELQEYSARVWRFQS